MKIELQIQILNKKEHYQHQALKKSRNNLSTKSGTNLSKSKIYHSNITPFKY